MKNDFIVDPELLSKLDSFIKQEFVEDEEKKYWDECGRSLHEGELFSYESTTSYSNALLEKQLIKTNSLQAELEKANQTISELQLLLNQERDERLLGEKSAKMHILIGSIVGVSGLIVAIISFFTSLL